MDDWTEKYRPSKLDEIVGNEKAVNTLRRWANKWAKGNPHRKAVILSGKPGIGKTSAAIALAKEFSWTLIELNTSDARNANKIKNVATMGSQYETFDDQGNFISSHQGGRKLILLDEADNLYERIRRDNTSNNSDMSDKGGKKAIVDTIKMTNQPIILVVNDYYGLIKGSGDILKKLCTHIKFFNPYPSQVFNLLKKICINENITVNQKILKTIADRSKGDIRSAVNDLQSISLDKEHIDLKDVNVLGYRDRDKIIFETLRELFKTKNIQSIKENTLHLDSDPRTMLFWVNENLPREYKDFEDLSRGYNALSQADIFLGRTFRRQNYGMWSYACDLMNGGVAVAKTRTYLNDRYNFPTWLRQKKSSKNNRLTKLSILNKISKYSHTSRNKSNSFLMDYFTKMFRNDTYFAIKMKNKYDLNESEIKFLLGEKNSHKIKNIINAPNKIKEKPIKETMQKKPKKEENKKETEEEKQPSLLDF